MSPSITGLHRAGQPLEPRPPAELSGGRVSSLVSTGRLHLLAASARFLFLLLAASERCRQLPALGSRLSDLGSRLSSRLAPGFLWSAELRTKTPGGKCIRSSALSSSSLPRRESNSPVIALARHSSLCLLGLLESVRTVESARSKHPLRLSVRLFLAAPFPPCPSVRPSVRLAVR